MDITELKFSKIFKAMALFEEFFKLYSFVNCFLPGYLVTLCECLDSVLHFFFKNFHLVSLHSIGKAISNNCVNIFKQTF